MLDMARKDRFEYCKANLEAKQLARNAPTSQFFVLLPRVVLFE